MIKSNPSLFIILSILFLLGCEQTPLYTPKPRVFPRVIFPTKSYQSYEDPDCPFTFITPDYTFIEKETSFFESPLQNDCWFDLVYPEFEARLHCSYFDMTFGENNFEKLKNDAFKMADWHNKRANYIDEFPINHYESQIAGYLFFIEGPAATPLQFYITDSTHHFLRGALYFNQAMEPDSMAPIYDFIRLDILTMIESLQWD